MNLPAAGGSLESTAGGKQSPDLQGQALGMAPPVRARVFEPPAHEFLNCNPFIRGLLAVT